MLEENCYVVWDSRSNATIIDPGDEEHIITEFVDSMNLRPKFVLNTHGHWDHTGANSVCLKYDIPLYIDKNDLDMISISGVKIVDLSRTKTIELGEMEIKVIHTPGHTNGSVCFQINSLLFTGDTLFRGSIGRTDLPGGSALKMTESLNLLRSFDKRLEVLPGHGPQTSLRAEIRSNPYLTDTAYLK